MNGAVEGAEIFAAVANHRAREGGPRFGGDFDRAGDEELVVWKHSSKRRTPNTERPMSNEARMQDARNGGALPLLLLIFLDKADVAPAVERAGACAGNFRVA